MAPFNPKGILFSSHVLQMSNHASFIPNYNILYPKASFLKTSTHIFPCNFSTMLAKLGPRPKKPSNDIVNIFKNSFRQDKKTTPKGLNAM